MAAKTSIYQDIASRTGGDIYIGVVGPVRSGKSTFIKRFMECVVLPQMAEGADKDRATDAMPQSGSGKNVMTTEPKFVPDNAVRVEMSEGLGFRVKLVDCVGFPIPGAGGLVEDGITRMVNTPWSKDPLPFEEAAVLGTEKVIREHATIGIVITCDGSIGDLQRDAYIDAEEKTVAKMKETNKPFVILLNSLHPESEETLRLAMALEEKYKIPTLAVNCYTMEESGFAEILSQIVLEFPIRKIYADIPEWILGLDKTHKTRKAVLDELRDHFFAIHKTGETFNAISAARKLDWVDSVNTTSSDLGSGSVRLELRAKNQFFYHVLSEESGVEIQSDQDLLRQFTTLSEKTKKYEKIADALKQVEESGYGIVAPALEDLTLEEPEIVKQSGGYGVKLKASAPSIHLIRANIQAEISPIVGSERQSEDIVKFLLEEFEEDPTKIWQSNLFGKSLYELVSEGLNTKLNHMPAEAREKLGETLQKIINEGSGGLICIIL